jgi:deoxyribodipyrimidine photolyase-related protein
VEDLTRDGIVASVLPTPGFILARQDFAAWADGRERLLMEDFYRDQRRRFGVLLEPGDDPQGGRWNLDHDNRERPPKQATLGVPRPYRPHEDAIDREVRRDLDRLRDDRRIDPVGDDGPRAFAVTRAEAHRALRRFLTTRLPTFGPYQDAMLSRDWAMSHALLSAPLNLGLLDPLYVVHQAERCLRDGRAPLNSVEGFIRQILGWREWIWHLYWYMGPSYLDRNALHATAALPAWWEELDADEVTARCLHDALAGVRDRGWVHHIQRLMILPKPRPAARLRATCPDRVVRHRLRRRPPVGDARERHRHEPVRRRRRRGDEAVRGGRRVHQRDERLLPRLPL